jgi:hypothetical protein
MRNKWSVTCRPRLTLLMSTSPVSRRLACLLASDNGTPVNPKELDLMRVLTPHSNPADT